MALQNKAAAVGQEGGGGEREKVKRRDVSLRDGWRGNGEKNR